MKPKQWKEGEEAGWIADKVCILGDYGQDAARVLRRQVEELSALRSQVAELQKDVQVARGQYQGACDIIKELQRQLDEAAKQESVAWVNEHRDIELGATPPEDFVCSWRPLYAKPINFPAIIEQAKAEEREEICAMQELHLSERQRDAIRARKP